MSLHGKVQKPTAKIQKIKSWTKELRGNSECILDYIRELEEEQSPKVTREISTQTETEKVESQDSILLFFKILDKIDTDKTNLFWSGKNAFYRIDKFPDIFHIFQEQIHDNDLYNIKECFKEVARCINHLLYPSYDYKYGLKNTKFTNIEIPCKEMILYTFFKTCTNIMHLIIIYGCFVQDIYTEDFDKHIKNCLELQYNNIDSFNYMWTWYDDRIFRTLLFSINEKINNSCHEKISFLQKSSRQFFEILVCQFRKTLEKNNFSDQFILQNQPHPGVITYIEKYGFDKDKDFVIKLEELFLEIYMEKNMTEDTSFIQRMNIIFYVTKDMSIIAKMYRRFLDVQHQEIAKKQADIFLKNYENHLNFIL